jgi:D-hydroxyproline dehydrogenase subunit beta
VDSQRADVAVVGGGIAGLAHAWEAARRGRSVVLFERDHKAAGASVRNFGLVWPVGQPADLLPRALRSRARWAELADRAGIALDPCGSLHLARADDEWAVLQEFAAHAAGLGFPVELLDAEATRRRFPAVSAQGLRGSLFSPTEACADPRQVLARLPRWLAETFGVRLRFGVAVCGVEMPRVRTRTGETWTVGRAVVCGGADFETLFPEVFARSGVRRCKLQMMRTEPQPGGWRLGPAVAGGLTLCHYPNFRVCPSLEGLKRRVEAELADFVRHGIHVLAAQNASGEIVIGDSHEYDADIGPFDKRVIEDLILGYLRGLVGLPEWTLRERWHGVYAVHPTLPLFTATPQPGAHVVTALGGSGMTMAFGHAEALWDEWEGSGPASGGLAHPAGLPQGPHAPRSPGPTPPASGRRRRRLPRQ